MNSHGVIYQYAPLKYSQVYGSKRAQKRTRPWLSTLGMGLIVLSIGGIVGPFVPSLKLEVGYALHQLSNVTNSEQDLPRAVPVVFNPLVTEDGASIDPINTEFSLIVPKVGINAEVIPAVNPAKPGEYMAALQKGIAHASTSYFPDEQGTVYLFSHSTNYDWFVRDLNAVFYLLKNLSEGDLMVVFYQGKRYTYRLTEKRVVGPNEVSYLVPQKGAKKLILQTCWPPGSTTERLLLFADLVEEQSQSI